jgi:hypothetical protein
MRAAIRVRADHIVDTVMRNPQHSHTIWKVVLGLFFVALIAGAYFLYPWLRTRGTRSVRLFEWFRSKEAHLDWMVHAGQVCNDAPFIIPTDAYIGFIWGDSFRPGHSHQGIDMFGGEAAGVTPVYSAYPGYLTRLPAWVSTIIIRVPQDPLQPERQIWLYYTHMADQQGNSFIVSQFKPGTYETYVEAGELLGYQGNYSGNPLNPTGVHLHFSIVLDDGQGGFRNELQISNTLDPSPYLGLPLNASRSSGDVIVCPESALEP